MIEPISELFSPCLSSRPALIYYLPIIGLLCVDRDIHPAVTKTLLNSLTQLPPCPPQDSETRKNSDKIFDPV